jgi:hypothetical protein
MTGFAHTGHNHALVAGEQFIDGGGKQAIYAVTQLAKPFSFQHNDLSTNFLRQVALRPQHPVSLICDLVAKGLVA